METFIFSRLPEKHRRKFWLTVSGAYRYMEHYCDGYYRSLSVDDNEESYPKWPHPDYQKIDKDISR